MDVKVVSINHRDDTNKQAIDKAKEYANEILKICENPSIMTTDQLLIMRRLLDSLGNQIRSRANEIRVPIPPNTTLLPTSWSTYDCRNSYRCRRFCCCNCEIKNCVDCRSEGRCAYYATAVDCIISFVVTFFVVFMLAYFQDHSSMTTVLILAFAFAALFACLIPSCRNNIPRRGNLEYVSTDRFWPDKR
jgi:hypothetical protein